MNEYQIRASNSAAKPCIVVWVGGRYVRCKGAYADLAQAKARLRALRRRIS